MSVKEQCTQAVKELCEVAKLKKGSVLVVGCSTSEVVGSKIGTNSDPDTAEQIFEGIYSELKARGIYLAVQCCEHLNRAIVTEADAVPGADLVNVIPQKKAGGSLATVAYGSFKNPVVVEEIKADAGIDIGGTLIGMHLKRVAVPVRLSINKIGEASIICARVRPKFIGGERAIYDKEMM
ncbi:MAG: TIGR01440 family protein [Ruminococcaceae bacterium]|nr:TIGR01440 family protein [Oscillospiraceae bacterium]